MRGRLRSASRSITRPPQRWQRPTKTRDPNWHRAGSGSTRVRMEAGREATTRCWEGTEPEGQHADPESLPRERAELADGGFEKESGKVKTFPRKKTRATGGGPPDGRRRAKRWAEPKMLQSFR